MYEITSCCVVIVALTVDIATVNATITTQQEVISYT